MSWIHGGTKPIDEQGERDGNTDVVAELAHRVPGVDGVDDEEAEHDRGALHAHLQERPILLLVQHHLDRRAEVVLAQSPAREKDEAQHLHPDEGDHEPLDEPHADQQLICREPEAHRF